MSKSLIIKVNTVGKYSKGVNIGTDYLSFYINRQINSLRITEAMAKAAAGKSYAKVAMLEPNDLYPTGAKDSKTLGKDGKPIYVAGEQLTVAEYWERRGVEGIQLFQFESFLTEGQEALIDAQFVSNATLAF